LDVPFLFFFILLSAWFTSVLIKNYLPGTISATVFAIFPWHFTPFLHFPSFYAIHPHRAHSFYS
ncbi:hypothetical protein BKA57DRAFT_475220, partial [Linnemannia elongata]